MSAWPPDLANDSALSPLGSAAFAEAPAFSNVLTTLVLPFPAAHINGVQPSAVGVFTFAPSDAKSRTVDS
jgi:hypothetical protein